MPSSRSNGGTAGDLCGIGIPLAGMDGNRTHPGRVIGAPQTVLKTAGAASTTICPCPQQFDTEHSKSAIVHLRPLSCIGLAVFLAVIGAKTEDS